MNKLWEYHFKYYDLFQNSFDNYRDVINLHLKELKKFKKILDTGAGTGNLTLELLKQKHFVTAVDSNKYSLDVLKNKCKNYIKNLNVQLMDVQEFKFEDESFDGVSSMFVIPFVNDCEKYLSEVYRVLREGGKFTLSAWTPVQDRTSLMKERELELKKKKILPKYQKEWEIILKSAKILAKEVQKGFETNELKSSLEKIGFKQVNILKNNPYKKYSCFITCIK